MRQRPCWPDPSAHLRADKRVRQRHYSPRPSPMSVRRARALPIPGDGRRYGCAAQIGLLCAPPVAASGGVGRLARSHAPGRLRRDVCQVRQMDEAARLDDGLYPPEARVDVGRFAWPARQGSALVVRPCEAVGGAIQSRRRLARPEGVTMRVLDWTWPRRSRRSGPACVVFLPSGCAGCSRSGTRSGP